MKTLWELKPSSSLVPELVHSWGISQLEAQILINRGLTEPQAVSNFLSPRLNRLSDPMTLKDMDKAVALIIETVENQEPITVYGDFDADGFTATALLCNFFSNLGIPASHYIPDRLTEGYGLHGGALKKIADRGKGVIITVDCGTTNQDAIDLADSLGLRLVVTDHHQVPEDFVPRCPVINPHRPDCSFPFKNLAGVGVSFFLAVALRAGLRAMGWFNRRQEPDLRDYLDLVALGTVADMVPLLDQNRILVKTGLEKIRNSRWPGIRAIAELADLGGAAVSASDLAYRMAPRLNASGRMGETEIGVMALITGQVDLARELAGKMETMNAKRQATERKIIEEIEDSLAGRPMDNRRTLVVAGRGWHRGVLGIVASRLVDRYNRPVLVLSIENGIASGSGRSVPGFNLYRALTRLAHLFQRYGGHKYAAGMSLKASSVENLAVEFEELARKEIREEDLLRSLEVDAKVAIKDMDFETIRRLASFSPFGPGNPEPVFYTGPCEVMERKVVGETHLKMKVRQNGAVIEAVGFGLAKNHANLQAPINLIFTPEIDRWQGRDKPRLRMIDVESADQPSKLISP